MMEMGTLPLEILQYIIDLLAAGGEDDDEDDIESLQILSQVCKSMVPLCRKHLFSSLLLRSKKDSKRFSALLLKNPEIARYVRDLNYKFCPPLSDHELNILDLLKKHSSLQSIRLSSPGSTEWNDLPESIRSSLVFLMQLPTVTRLDIGDIRCPATALSGCSNLIDLWLGELKLAPPEVNQIISRSKIPTPVFLFMWRTTHGLAVLLNSANLHAGGPIIDFSRLQKAEFHVEYQDGIGRVNELIKVTSRLEHFHLNLLRPLGLAGLGASLATNAYRTLKLLELGVPVIEDNYDFLRGFNREFRFIAGNNILEALKLYLNIEDETSFQTKSEDWAALDSMLTESGAFPMLHRVSVEISGWLVSESMCTRERDAMLESLKEEKFPRLMKGKAVKLGFRAYYADECCEEEDRVWYK